MARPSTGQVLERKTKAGTTYALRFRFNGKRTYLTVGTDKQGVTRREAEKLLRDTLGAIRLGIWQPPKPTVPDYRDEAPTFHVFATEWLARREREGLRPKTLTALRWNLCNHLLPFFADYGVHEITKPLVFKYVDAKMVERDRIAKERAAAKQEGLPYAERPLSNNSINQTVRILAQVLDEAVEDDLLSTNPARSKRVRLKGEQPARPWVEPEQLPTLLEAATGTGRLVLALLAGAGLRMSEALALRWSHVDLGKGTLRVMDAKTPKGVREVHLTHSLRETLALARADRLGDDDGFVIATSTNRQHNASNLRRDKLHPAVTKANEKLAELGIAPIGHCTFHAMRRTYASIRCVIDKDSLYVADQLGHTDSRFTERVYRQTVKRRDLLDTVHGREFDRAIEWARMGTNEPLVVPDSVAASAL